MRTGSLVKKMDFNDPDYCCPDLVRLAQNVLARIPEEVRLRIEKVCARVLFLPEGDTEAEFFPDQSEIQVFVSRVRDLPREVQRGIIVHEFGHAYDFAIRDATPGITAEKTADAHAQNWGFYCDIEARKRDAARLRKG